MVDVGDCGRPPGDPPDNQRSWAKMVAAGGSNGMPNPEGIFDAKFVKERLCVEFPDGKAGEPVVTVGAEVLEVMNGLWRRCMIVKVLGRSVSVSVLSRRLRDLWKPAGAMHVMDLPRQFFMIRFEKEEEYMAALTGGPWRVFGSCLLTQAWSPSFDPLRDEITTTPVWIRLSNLPVNFYHQFILMGIAEGLGTPIKVDLTTLQFERARFARICVEVDLKNPLKGTILINGERYFVSYEGLTTICSKCGMYGHLVHACPLVVKENVSVHAQVVSGGVVSEVSSMDDGFAVVRDRERRTKPREEKSNTTVGVRGGSQNRNLREIPVTKVIRNISISNKFGSLG
ncbi:hypothetical protein CARUB_v10016088mg, partial [Capsella rubella]